MRERHPGRGHGADDTTSTGQPAPEKKRSIVVGLVVAAILVALVLMLLVGLLAG